MADTIPEYYIVSMTKYRAFLTLPLLVSTLFAKVHFHSDFECGETTTARKLKPGAKSIDLISNFRLEEWDENGGEGIVEGNLPQASEVFKYDRRQGSVLKGVTGIRKSHVKGVDIRTGNLNEWFAESRCLDIKGMENLNVAPHNPLFGNYSLRFTQTNGLAFIEELMPAEKAFYACRFYIRFSNEALEPEEIRLPLCFFVCGHRSLQRLVLKREKGDKIAAFELEKDKRISIVRKNNDSPPKISILAGQTYCVEYTAQLIDSDRAIVSCFVDGKLQDRHHATYKKKTNLTKNTFFIGRISASANSGVFTIDEVMVANRRIGAFPQTPTIRCENDQLLSTPYLEPGTGKHAASHWQIARENAWLVPFFSSGIDTVTLAEMAVPYHHVVKGELSPRHILATPVRIPLGFQSGKEYLARIRHQNRKGIWSQWSRPVSFRAAKSSIREKASRELPVIEKAYFSEIGKDRPLQKIQKGVWYDFHLRIRDPHGWDNLRFADIFLQGNPQNNTANYLNRGGPFFARDNYVLSFSINTNKVFVKQSEGSDRFSGTFRKQGLYFDDFKGQYVQSPKTHSAKARIRLLNSAVCGPWVVSGYALNKDKKVSNMYRKPFHVLEKTPPPKPFPLAGIVVLGIGVLLMAGAVVIYLRSRKISAVGASQAQTEETPKDPLYDDSPYSERIRTAREYVRENFGKDISAQDVANIISVSPNYLSRIFHKETGMTLIHYLNAIRIEEAKKLLKEKDLNIGEIAVRVGFNSQYHFSHAFKNYTDVSPSDYRAQHAGD